MSPHAASRLRHITHITEAISCPSHFLPSFAWFIFSSYPLFSPLALHHITVPSFTNGSSGRLSVAHHRADALFLCALFLHVSLLCFFWARSCRTLPTFSLISTQPVEYRPPSSQLSFALTLIYAPHISHSRLPIASAFVVQYNVLTLIVFVSYHALKSTFATMQYMYHAISTCVSVNDGQPNLSEVMRGEGGEGTS